MPVTKRLATLVSLVYVCTLFGCGGATASRNNTPSPSPTAGMSSVKNIIVVVMQNGSFDHYFGTFPGVDGIRPGVPGFTQTDRKGHSVSPALLTSTSVGDLPHSRQDYLDAWDNGAMDGFAKVGGATALGFYDNTTPGVASLWTLAQQFAISDRFFASVMGDAPTNQLMMVAADDNDSPFSIDPFFGPCENQVSARVGYTFQNVGDQLTAKGVTWAWFAENLGQCNAYVAQENPFQFFTTTHAAPNVQDFTAFSTMLSAGTPPAVSFIQPNPLHSTHPGNDITPALTFLSSLIQQVQASAVWNQAAIIVVWDAAGGWWDHVPPTQVDDQGLGFRVPLLVVSPFAKKNYVSHVLMDDVSILRFIQEVNGLPMLNARNGTSADMSDLFTF